VSEDVKTGEVDLCIIENFVEEAKRVHKGMFPKGSNPPSPLRPVWEEETKYKPEEEVNLIILGMEVGDDRVDVSNSAQALCLMLVLQDRLFHMKTSWDDTCVTNSLWNFCETTGTLPTAIENSWQYTRNTKDTKSFGFTDYAPLRIIVDVRKGGANVHSNTQVGKARMIASRDSLVSDNNRSHMDIANFLQDGMLAMHRAKDPKYLPLFLGGIGCRAPFGNSKNIFYSVKSYRGGGYDRLYGSATQEVLDCLQEAHVGSMRRPKLANFLRLKQNYLHGTYKNIVVIPDMEYKRTNLPEPLYEGHEGETWIRGPEQRLLRSRVIVDEVDANIEMARTERINSIIFGWSDPRQAHARRHYDICRKRDAFESALSANSAFMSLVNRIATGREVRTLIDEGWDFSRSGMTEFTQSHATWIMNGCKGDVFNATELPFTNRIYLREEVSVDESFRVGKIPLNFQYGTKRPRIENTTTEIGLYQISDNMLEWCNKKAEALKEARALTAEKGISRERLRLIYGTNREWVSDDTQILSEISSKTLHNTSSKISIVTTDLKLCKRAMDLTGGIVYRVDPQSLLPFVPQPINADREEEIKYLVNEFFANQVPMIKLTNIFLDWGSLSSHAMQYTKSMNSVVHKTVVRTGHTERRTVLYDLKYVIPEIRYVAFFPDHLRHGKRRDKTPVRAVSTVLSGSSWRRQPPAQRPWRRPKPNRYRSSSSKPTDQ
jgi:hypothetical protein